MYIDVIIVNWNAGEQLLECVGSVIKYGKAIVDKIIVVDNGSIDGSIDALVGLPNVILIQAGSNLGFAKACNLGAQLGNTEFLLFLNPDARLFVDTLSSVLKFMQKKESAKVGICGVQLIDEDGVAGTSAARFPTLSVLVGKSLGLAKLLPSLFPEHLITKVDVNQEVDQVIGAFFLIRKSIFDRCRGFDERFFVYFEEVDLSLRVKNLGFSSYFLSDVSAFHKGGGCSEQVLATRLFYYLRSRVLYAQKHYSAVSYALLLALTMVEFPLRLIQSVVRHSWIDVKNTLIAYRMLIICFLWRS